MQKIFDTLIDSFIADKVGIADGFLTEFLAANLRDNINTLHATNQFAAAGVGNNKVADQNSLIRNDKIYWLDRIHNNIHENLFFDLIDAFVKYLNETCYTGITGYEFHYTLYEKGNFYLKHLDQFKNNSSRKYSMILYLNTDWKDGDGGELCVHHSNHLQLISPNNGKSIFFKSDELHHEVLINHQTRISITGWLKVD
ncbi:2OG-Fe(II) oxygenase [Pedobacter namyangjuensis]|uniref:2OG-Fe(II) oxygenase n=1 Tax=Pedobacter namyangjuensis TaxID=600626 RepID=UPI000DE351FA|nr:2OG-Fe(II) oxygenase [Pedobacter namyangjuensis]